MGELKMAEVIGPAARTFACAWLAMAVLALPGCATNDRRPESDAPRVVSDDPATREQAEIYSAVIRQQATVDDTFGGELDKRVVYIVARTDDRAADPSWEDSATTPISAEVRSAISSALVDAAFEVEWVDRADGVDLDQSRGIFGRKLEWADVIVTLGTIQRIDSDTVKVGSSIYIGNLAAGGQTYLVERVGGVWKVTGTTGPSWIS